MWIFDSKSRMIIASEIGDCDGNAMRMFSECGLMFSEVNLYEMVS